MTQQVTGTVKAGTTAVLSVVIPASARAFTAVLEGTDELSEFIQESTGTVLGTATPLATVAVAAVSPVASM